VYSFFLSLSFSVRMGLHARGCLALRQCRGLADDAPPLRQSVAEALARVWVVACASSFEFVASLEVAAAALRGREVLVVVDSLGTLHFRDKATEAVCGEGSTLGGHATGKALARLLACTTSIVLAAKPVLFHHRGPFVECACVGMREFAPVAPLLRFSIELRVIDCCSRMPCARSLVRVGCGATDGGAFEHREYCPASWQGLVSHRLNLVRTGGRVDVRGPRFEMWLRCRRERRRCPALPMLRSLCTLISLSYLKRGILKYMQCAWR